jgi:hypothetical protein
VVTRTRFKLLSHSNLHNKVLWLLVLNFIGSPIHPPPSRCSEVEAGASADSDAGCGAGSAGTGAGTETTTTIVVTADAGGTGG